MDEERKPVIAVLGGTGKEGSGLALRWASRGYEVVVGSRSPERAIATAAALNARLGDAGNLRGAGTRDAAASAEIVVLCVPYAAQQVTVDEVADLIAGKILVDVTVPLVPPKVGRVQLPAGGSAVEAVQQRLGPAVRVVSAFQNISAHHLLDLEAGIDCDVLVCADDSAAAETIVGLAEAIGLDAFNAGPLANSAVAEGLTSILITLNRRYKVPASGIRITGLPPRIS